MRRKDRQITPIEAYSILETGVYGILSTLSPEGEPYGVPLNYCLIGEKIYFHCALEGEKIDNMDSCSRVSFCVVGTAEILPDKFSIRYESCIAKGAASESFGEEKRAALEGLVKKYSAEYTPEGMAYIEKLDDRTRVFKIAIDSITGKTRI
jgi:nitroimidazol reductase NimA-like FMN-containing flavoprotein (pyridoxamine 5'-phosphate oxidase superfamily)